MGDRADDVLVQDVELLGGCVLLEQLGGDSSLSSQHDAILSEDTDGSTSVGDGLKGILDLVETALWGEDCRLGSDISCWSPYAMWSCKSVVLRIVQPSPV